MTPEEIMENVRALIQEHSKTDAATRRKRTLRKYSGGTAVCDIRQLPVPKPEEQQ